jgi:hypothetical protein
MRKLIVITAALCLEGFTATRGSPVDEDPAVAAVTDARAQQKKGAASRFCILFLDVGGIPDAEDFAEGELLARTLRYKLKFDYTYLDDPAMSRLYPAIELDHLLGTGTDTRSLMARAHQVELVTEKLTSPQQFAEVLAKHRPNVVHVLAHGAGKAGFDAAAWGDHGGQMFPFSKIQKALGNARLDLGEVCLVTPGCDLGRKEILDGLLGLGFGCVIAWPGSVCAQEAFEFNGDLYEALFSLYVLHRGAEPFWAFGDGCPRALQRSFDFAVASLEARYRLLDEHFQDVAGRPGVAGYYLHTPAWFGKPYEYAATPVLGSAR